MYLHQTIRTIFTFMLCLECMVSIANGRLFRNLNSSVTPPKVCSLLSGLFNISVTAVRDGSDVSSVVVTSDMADIEVRGDCEFYMALTWPNSISWQITDYNTVYEFNVLFEPYRLFPEITSSSTLEVYDSPTKANLLGTYASYKCSRSESKRYVGGVTGELSYRVQVAMEDIQVQVARLGHGGFSPAIHECGTEVKVASPPSEKLPDSNLVSRIFLVPIIAPLVLVLAYVVVGFLMENNYLRVELKRLWQPQKLHKDIQKPSALPAMDAIGVLNTTLPPDREANPTIQLWSMILPVIIFITLILYFLNVIYYYYRTLQNLDELNAGHSYMSNIGALDNPRRPDIHKKQQRGQSATFLESKDSEFSFKPSEDETN